MKALEKITCAPELIENITFFKSIMPSILAQLDIPLPTVKMLVLDCEFLVDRTVLFNADLMKVENFFNKAPHSITIYTTTASSRFGRSKVALPFPFPNETDDLQDCYIDIKNVDQFKATDHSLDPINLGSVTGYVTDVCAEHWGRHYDNKRNGVTLVQKIESTQQQQQRNKYRSAHYGH